MAENSEYNIMKEKMEKTIASLKENFQTIRAGRANPSVLNKISVNYYGSPAPISQVGNISVPEARIITIQPWESNMLKEIEKAIQKSDLGINPTNDGKIIRLVFPALTEERRKEINKQIKKDSDEYKIQLRNIRRDTMDALKEQKKKSLLTEDDLKIAEKDVQKILDKYILEIDKVAEAKTAEIMEL